MKKRKFNFIFNIVTICLSICAIAIGVYSLTTASLTINGSVGFTVHECRVYISAYMYGYADTASGTAYKKPTTDAEKQYLIYDTSKRATDDDPMIVSNNNQSLSFNIGEGNGVYFSSEAFDNEIKPIVIVLRVANVTENMVLVQDTTTVSTDAQYELDCDNQADMLYTQGDDLSTIITYTLTPKKDSSGNYVAISDSVSVSLSLSFSKFENNISTTGFTLSETSIIGVPATQNGGTDLLIIPSKFSDSTTVYTSLGGGSTALSNVNNYKKVIVLEGITTANNNAFKTCTNIESISLPKTFNSAGDYAFNACENLKFKMRNGLKAVGDYAFSSCFSLKADIEFLNGITTIGEGAFENCFNITSIKFPNTLKTIDDSAFDSCTSLTELTIPGSVTSLGSAMGNPFNSCTNLVTVVFEEGEENLTLGYTFAYCSSLTTVKLPKRLTSLTGYTFSLCTSLTTINIPVSVTSIGQRCIAENNSLEYITYEGTKSQWNQITLDEQWKEDSANLKTIKCTDGDITL